MPEDVQPSRDADLVTQVQSVVQYLGRLVQALKNLAPRLAGSFTLAAAATTNVVDPRVIATTVPVPFPKNAAAATLQQGAKSLYVSAVTPGVGFSVTTADGTNAAGTEQFYYIGTESN